LNIEMDQRAKDEWNQRWESSVDNTPQHIPSKGWSLWYGGNKFMSFGRETLDYIIQAKYLKSYWQ